jgi:hypothetical protein
VMDASKSGKAVVFPKDEAKIFWKRVGGRDGPKDKAKL